MAEELQKLKKLTPLEIRERLPKLKGYSIENGRLEKEYRFENFAKAMLFLNKIMNPIEEHQSYPKIAIAYDRVRVSLFSGAVGALTELDFLMAAEFNELSGPKPVNSPEEDNPNLIKA